MNIVQITPGAGGMYCGNCFHDNALVAALRQLGHQVLMVPLYLPMTLDEEDQSRGAPNFFSGINRTSLRPWLLKAYSATRSPSSYSARVRDPAAARWTSCTVRPL